MAFKLVRQGFIFQREFQSNTIRLYKINNATNIKYYSAEVKTEKQGWTSWRTIVTRFVPIGICLVAVMQWRAYRKISAEHVAKKWEVDLYCSLPLRAFSRSWGWLADIHLPVIIRPWIYGLYASAFGVNVAEAQSSDFKDYACLADFFSRGLKDGARVIDTSSCITSPCDGKVLYCNTVNSCNVEQVKGVTYSLQQFLGDGPFNEEADPRNCSDYRLSLLENPENKPTTLYQCILYLAPGDYHRFHSPAEWKPTSRRHFAGELLSVSPGIAKWIPGLFCLNERAVYLGSWQHGFFSFTAVGATNVGSVKVYFDKCLQTNVRKEVRPYCDSFSLKDEDVTLKKGDPVGEFRMGSTIVLIFEAPVNFQFNLKPGQSVKMGDRKSVV